MISFASAPGNLYNILGKCGLLIKAAKSYQTSQQTNLTNTTTGLVAQLNAMSDIQAQVGNQWQGQLTTVGSTIGSLATTVGTQGMNRIVFNDNPRISQTLQQLNTTASIQYVIQQMQQQGATILAMVIGATPSTITGIGTGVINASTKRPYDGRVLENSFAENITLTCTSDSYTGGAVVNNEGFTVTGEGSSTNPFDFNWPLGSNAQTSLNAIDANTSNGSGNLLTNSAFTSWTSNTPNNFTIVTGSPGTNIFQENTIVYGTGSAMRILGDNATLINFNQPFNNAAGTTATLTAQTQYSFCVFARRGGTVVTSGSLQISLVDQNFNIINDQAGTPNSFTIDLTTLTTAYVNFMGTFRTPTILPSAQYIRFQLLSPINTGAMVYLDNASFGLMTQIYTSGPFAAVHAGNIPFVANDYGAIVVTNSRGAGGTLSTFQTLLTQLFYPLTLTNEFIFPSSSVPSISDGLIG